MMNNSVLKTNSNTYSTGKGGVIDTILIRYSKEHGIKSVVLHFLTIRK